MYYLMSTNRVLLEAISNEINAGEGYPIPGNVTKRHADIETNDAGDTYAYILDDVVGTKHVRRMIRRIATDNQVDWFRGKVSDLRSEKITRFSFSLPVGTRFSGTSVTVGRVPTNWFPPDLI